LLTNEQGGVIDDLIVTRWSDDQFMLVINAGCKEKDLAHLRTQLNGLNITELSEHSLLALQGPHARAVLTRLFPDVGRLAFMNGMWVSFKDESLYITCSGYTGEDGFEISVPNHAVLASARLRWGATGRFGRA
jgi:aminomethyltransferase